MRYITSTFELVLLFAALVSLATTYLKAALLLSFALLVAASVCFAFGWKIRGIRSRGKAALVVLVCLMTFVVMAPMLEYEVEAELSSLRETDTAEFLRLLQQVDDTRWLEALKELRPDEYELETDRRRQESEEHRAAQCTDQKANLAYVMIQNDVKQRLQAPSTAKFPARKGEGTGHVTDCVYRVTGYFEAQNGFGATVRGRFEGRIEYFPNSKSWRTLTLEVR